MMQLQQRINAFAALGTFLKQFGSEHPVKQADIPYNDEYFSKMESALQRAKTSNGWFTDENLRFACESWGDALTKKNVSDWLSPYSISEEKTPKKVAIIMAGNIPLVGFHDFICVLLSGHHVNAKLSSNDPVLLPLLAEYLITVEKELQACIQFTTEKLTDFDAVIATGSNNTARYFEHYFGSYPNIIRKNRNSVAILTGNETAENMEALSDDIFRYFGLGCRNVSKLFVPENYAWDSFFEGMYKWKDVINNHKYINNYDYNKAVYLMSNCKLLDNEFLLLKEDQSFSSPIAVVFYETYADTTALETMLASYKDEIQCIVSKNHIPFGAAQQPALNDYADGVDTLQFLLDL